RSNRIALFDSDFRALLCPLRKILDPFIDDFANRLQELDPRIGDVLAHPRRNAEMGAELIEHLPAQAAFVSWTFAGRPLLFRLIPYCGSFFSTVRPRSSNLALAGVNVAMVRGKPIWRRSVPTSTTSSSPFLKRPTSPFAANGSAI